MDLLSRLFLSMFVRRTVTSRCSFICKWKCFHCGHENQGLGQIEARASGVHTRFTDSDSEEKAALKQLGKKRETVIEKVNHLHKHHKVLNSVKVRCSCCGEKQPWQIREWKDKLVKILKYFFITMIILFFVAAIIMCVLGENEWQWPDTAKIIVMSLFGFVLFGVPILLLIVTKIYPFIRGRMGFRKIAANDESCYPKVLIPLIPTAEEPKDVFLCPKCKAPIGRKKYFCPNCGLKIG